MKEHLARHWGDGITQLEFSELFQLVERSASDVDAKVDRVLLDLAKM